MNFYCTNCGELGKAKRKIALCPACDYDGIMEFDDEEFRKECLQKHRHDLLETKPARDRKVEPIVTIEPDGLKGVLEP